MQKNIMKIILLLLKTFANQNFTGAVMFWALLSSCKKENMLLSGFNIIIDSDLPVGAGMASSAAIECATVFALNELFELGISKLEMVKIAQKAEQEFVGLQCGIMDMFTSMFGKKDHVICLDCRSL